MLARATNYYVPLVESEDITQQAALLALQGTTSTNRGIIFKKLTRSTASAFSASLDDFDEGLSDQDLDGLVDQDYNAIMAAREDLIAWSLGQAIEIQSLIEEFLEERDAETTCSKLIELGVIQPAASKSTAPKATYSDAMLRSLPATKTDLINMLRGFGIARPDSTFRQWHRRLVKNGKISYDELTEEVRLVV